MGVDSVPQSLFSLPLAYLARLVFIAAPIMLCSNELVVNPVLVGEEWSAPLQVQKGLWAIRIHDPNVVFPVPRFDSSDASFTL